MVLILTYTYISVPLVFKSLFSTYFPANEDVPIANITGAAIGTLTSGGIRMIAPIITTTQNSMEMVETSMYFPNPFFSPFLGANLVIVTGKPTGYSQLQVSLNYLLFAIIYNG